MDTEKSYPPISSTLNRSLLWGIVLTFVVTLGAAVLLSLVPVSHPGGITASGVIQFGTMVIMLLVGYMVKDSHDATNHRLDEFKDIYAQLKKQEGRAELQGEIEQARVEGIVALSDAAEQEKR